MRKIGRTLRKPECSGLRQRVVPAGDPIVE